MFNTKYQGLGKTPWVGSSTESDKPKRKGGFFKRLVQAALGALTVANPIVGALVTLAVKELIKNDDGSSWIMSRMMPQFEYEPTPIEEGILESWLAKKFNLFNDILLNDLAAALKSANAATRIEGINIATAKMCVAAEYFKYNETDGLSPDAIIFRNDLIQEVFTPIRALIQQHVAGLQETKVVVTAQPDAFTPFWIEGTYQCTKFVAASSSNLSTKTPPTKTLDPNPTVNVGTEVKPTQTVTDQTETTKTNKPNTGLVLAALGTIAFLFWPSKKRNKK